MSNIFSFNTKSSKSNFAASPENIQKGQYIDLIRGSLEKVQLPVIFKQFQGKKFLDVLNTGYVSLYLVSDRFLQLLEDNQLTGWQTYPIILLDQEEKEISGYHGFSIIGSCFPEDYSKSEIVEYQYVEKGPLVKHYRGYQVIPCDDYDFFIPPRSIGLYINEKTAEILKINKITNVRLINIAEDEVRCKTVNSTFQG